MIECIENKIIQIIKEVRSRKMVKKGFTLIELLAVIVMLAITSFITVPMILNVVEEAKEKSTKASALGYIDAVEKQVAVNELDISKIKVTNQTYTVEELTSLGVKVKGEKPTNESSLTLEKVIVKACSLIIGKYKITCLENGELKLEKEMNLDSDPVVEYKVYGNGTAIYYNPETNKICNEIESDSTTGTKTGCMKWYTFNDKKLSSTVNMILDHNTTAKTTTKTVTNDTQNWDSSLNARLITIEEVAKITGNDNFNATTAIQENWFYLDSNSQTQTAKSQGASKYAWLFDYTNGCTNNGCNVADSSNYGYWTNNLVTNNSNLAWHIYNTGTLHHSKITNSDYGIRPVITVQKSKLD